MSGGLCVYLHLLVTYLTLCSLRFQKSDTNMKSPKKRQEPVQRRPGLNLRTCMTCHRDISEEVYIKCTRCAGFNQCLECFSVGYEAQLHLRTHPFVVMEPFVQPVFQKGWTAEEEITFLDSIQTYGMGNWQEIADVLKTKTSIECERHYFSTFMESESTPIPGEHVISEAVLPPPLPFDTTARESRPSIAHDKNLQERGKKERTTPAEFAGWMPRRMEFEVEFLNEAEQMIGQITFNDADETPESLEQKLAELRVYNEKLGERTIRTQFAVEWDLLDKEFKSFGGRTKQERDMEDALMPIAQIIGKDDMLSVIGSFQDEMRLKEQIEMYRKWRQNGIGTRDEGFLFNQLESLVGEDKLSASAIEKWNRDVTLCVESEGFRATRDRQVLSVVENELCQKYDLPPYSYLDVKDLLLREFTIRGTLTREMAVSFLPSQKDVVGEVFDNMEAAGLFHGMDDIMLASAEPETKED